MLALNLLLFLGALFGQNLSQDCGAEFYALYCAACHGQNGQGRLKGNATSLNNQDFLSTATDEFLERTIARGRPGTEMSAFGKKAGGPLSSQEIKHLIAFLRSWQKEAQRELRTGIRGSARLKMEKSSTRQIVPTVTAAKARGSLGWGLR